MDKKEIFETGQVYSTAYRLYDNLYQFLEDINVYQSKEEHLAKVDNVIVNDLKKSLTTLHRYIEAIDYNLEEEEHAKDTEGWMMDDLGRVMLKDMNRRFIEMVCRHGYHGLCRLFDLDKKISFSIYDFDDSKIVTKDYPYYDIINSIKVMGSYNTAVKIFNDVLKEFNHS